MIRDPYPTSVKRLFAGVLVGILLGTMPASRIEASGAVSLAALVEQEVEIVGEDGRREVKRVEAAKVVPGDEVIYTIRYENAGPDPADNVIITNPVPRHMVCTHADVPSRVPVVLTFSVDGGDHYDVSHRLQVVEASGEVRSAQPSDYTHIRWAFEEPLAPGAQGSVSFRAQLQ